LRGGVGGGSAGAPAPPGRAGAADGRSPRCERRRRLPRGRLRELNRRRGGVDPEALRRDEEVAARDSGRARVLDAQRLRRGRPEIGTCTPGRLSTLSSASVGSRVSARSVLPTLGRPNQPRSG
jgi:hypothetical protein